ncbi:MAG: hypothetical protein OXU62_11065 [Gammaproteobacteria bacterium]|nr:hypothetical protein [Gammaproteobacteria bacterium]
MKTRPSRISCLSVAGAGRGGIRASRVGVRGAVGAAVIAFVAAAALPQAAQAQAADIAVLHNKMDNVNLSIERIDKRLDRMGKRLDRMDDQFKRVDQRFGSVEQSIVRLDEKMNGLQMQNQFVIIPLLLLLVATMFGLLTKGVLWAVAREPGAVSGSRSAQTPPQRFQPS